MMETVVQNAIVERPNRVRVLIYTNKGVNFFPLSDTRETDWNIVAGEFRAALKVSLPQLEGEWEVQSMTRDPEGGLFHYDGILVRVK